MRPNLLAAAIAVPLSLLAAQIAQAGEGMWVPQQLPEIAGPLKKAGLKLSPQQISDLTGDPMGAVVALGGCTASFVSPNGLVVTNHHCAYGAIQLNSTAENNLIKNGFNAPTTGDEVSAGPNARVFVLDEITDVTMDAKAAIAAAGDDALARTKALEAFEKKLIADCEAEAGATGGGGDVLHGYFLQCAYGVSCRVRVEVLPGPVDRTDPAARPDRTSPRGASLTPRKWVPRSCRAVAVLAVRDGGRTRQTVTAIRPKGAGRVEGTQRSRSCHVPVTTRHQTHLERPSRDRAGPRLRRSRRTRGGPGPRGP